ncbi:sodium/potassium/calcium exchanger 5-like isoform X2 [Tubulanus polymorphus]|uniref:sodium/potassium/calcium exchanger 5-like isoform X2 n=1 Tax=Tubulanus polymorphus TaxID=672921 RepID=UPI003DA32A81
MFYKKTFRSLRRIQGVILTVGLLSLWLYGNITVVGDTEAVVAATDGDDDSIYNTADNKHSHYSYIRRQSRGLLGHDADNCSPAAVEQFPNDAFTMEQRRRGAVIIHIIASLYSFWGLAIACDDYFVPSLEKISDVLRLQEDVAGATLMAAGSSAPELATAVIGVFIVQDDIGLGAVVGSAVFNIMFVIGICAICAGAVVNLHWWPLFRDCICYLLSIIALTAIIYDEIIHWYEGVILLVLYALYIVLMFFNPTIEKWMVEKCTCFKKRSEDEFSHLVHFDAKRLLNTSAAGELQESADLTSKTDIENGIGDHPGNGVTVPLLYDDSSSADSDSTHEHFQIKVKEGGDKESEDIDEEDHLWVLAIPKQCYQQFMWVLSLPLNIVMFLTIPDCRRNRWKRCYGITFILSLVWISVFSYIMVWMITVIGFTLGIPDTVLAMTLVAAGVSVPDAIASIIVIKDGYGDMAVSNAIGSNVFDILLCLGLPWTLKTLTKNGNPVQVFSQGLTYATLTLLTTVVFLLLATHLNGWRLTKRYGIILIISYIIVTAVSCLFELNIFGHLRMPACPSAF